MISLILLSTAIATASAGYLDHSSAYGYATAPAVDLTYGYGAPSYASPSYASPSYASPSYASPSYASPSYASPSYTAPSYGAPIVKAYAPTATSYSNTFHIAKSVPIAAASPYGAAPVAPIYKAASLAYAAPAYGAHAAPAYGAHAAISTAYGPSYASAPAYGHGYYGPSYSHGYLH